MNAAEDLTPPTSRSGYGATREPTPPVYVDSENTPEQFQAIVSPAPLSRGRFLFEHMNTVVRRLTAKQMPVEPRMVLTVMVDHANAEGIAWPAVETVADMAGVSEGTARKAIRQLVDNGWLTALNGTKGGRETVRYRVNLNGRPLSVAADPRPRQGYTARTPGVHAEHPRGTPQEPQGFTPNTPGVHAVMPRGAPREPDPHSDPHNHPPIYPQAPPAPARPSEQPFVLTPPGPKKRKAPAPRSDHPMPNDWQHTPEHETLAKREGLNLEAEEERFRFWAEGKVSSSWNGRFSTWLLKSGKDRRDAGDPPYEPPPPRLKIPLVAPPPAPLRRMTFEEARAKQAASFAKLQAEEDARMAARAAEEAQQ